MLLAELEKYEDAIFAIKNDIAHIPIDQKILEEKILLEVDLPNLKIMFDLYHIHHMKGEVLIQFQRAKKHIGHIQIASVQKRNEPSNYEFDFLKEILNDDTIKTIVGWC